MASGETRKQKEKNHLTTGKTEKHLVKSIWHSGETRFFTKNARCHIKTSKCFGNIAGSKMDLFPILMLIFCINKFVYGNFCCHVPIKKFLLRKLKAVGDLSLRKFLITLIFLTIDCGSESLFSVFKLSDKE